MRSIRFADIERKDEKLQPSSSAVVIVVIADLRFPDA
jgi:hypothetical protein